MPEIESQWTPPDWMKADVDKLLRMAISDRLYTRGGDLTGSWGWFRDHAERARPATDEESEVLWILEERGYLVAGLSCVLVDESGELFRADRVEITPSGRELFERLNPKR